jgi:hypothetical protein
MAIIQISKIQQRSGNLVNLPQLDEAQFGWANDTKQLFIGASNVAVTNVENVEVLTSYSTISFSQVEGSNGSNVNITNVLPGQILAYDINTNSWINTGGNAESPDNTAEYEGIPIHLGTISNVKIGGGATGYILETDGQGNLNWTSKGTLYTNIIALSDDTPIVMTVANTTPYTNDSEITITGSDGANANAIVNGQTFYITLSVDYPTSGNVNLYTDFSRTVAADGTNLGVSTPNVAIATSIIGSSVSNPGGSVNSIQYNDSGIFNGSANFTITGGNIVSLTGSFTATTIAGSLTTAAQPNITSVGTLSGLVVAGNIIPNANITYNLGNNTNRFNDLYLANSTIYIGTQTISANATSVSISGDLVANITGNVTGNSSTAGTVTTNAQPNITSVGTLTSLSSSGNITGANITGTHYGAATGLTSIPGANVSGTVAYANIANSVAVANVTGIGNIATINKDGNSSNVLYGNGVFAAATGGGNGTYGDSNVVTLLSAYGSNSISTTGNITAGNFIGNGAGTPTLSSSTNLDLSANVAVRVVGGGTLTFPNLTSAAIANVIAANGDVAYNITSNKFQAYEAGAWSNVSDLPTTVLTTGANSTAGAITGNWTLTTGSRLLATYADLAEYYEADAVYKPGTVLAFGGDKEVTIAENETSRVAGVVSTNPAYAMNANCKGISTAVALQGRVPTKVRGIIHKGDMMVSAGNGFAKTSSSPQMGTVIGKALENFDGFEGVIEIAVGRL